MRLTRTEAAAITLVIALVAGFDLLLLHLLKH